MFTGQKYHHSNIGVNGFEHHPKAAFIQNIIRSKPWYKNWPSKGEGTENTQWYNTIVIKIGVARTRGGGGMIKHVFDHCQDEMKCHPGGGGTP